ncbi:methyltransferase domain-containing protein [bacterium]|nr:methyltransferase domain-containing protein [bacterium]NDC94382.1 methyltransferase domain-containing protein [bacterium]NDD83915.1 methyltransferase domain-containing protein [bacterium]NDG29703.1 methyltransferase domain-containing protein [bacterium]
MELNENHYKVLEEFIGQVGPGKEFEIRFGKFNYNKDQKTTSFESNVGIEFFYRLLRHFRGCLHNKVTQTSDKVYGNGTRYDTTQKTISQKKKARKYDIYDFEIRLSLCEETTIDKDEPPQEEPVCIRNKNRTSFEIPFGKIEMTIVDTTFTNSNTTQRTYELELEITEKTETMMVLDIIKSMLQMRQNNFYVISHTDRRRVIKDYRTLVNSNFFIGAQPETLQKDKLTQLYKQRYSVTDKADGERYFLFIDSYSRGYFIDSNVNTVMQTDLNINPNIKSTIMDGEIVRTPTTISFLAFDMVVYNGLDLRGKGEFLLEQRLGLLTEASRSIFSNERYTVSVKEYIFRNVFLGSEVLLSTPRFYLNDGLIFTPMDEPYPLVRKWPGLLKWKPSELNTIDFYSVKRSRGEWELYVQHVEKQGDKPISTKVLFNIDKLTGTHRFSNIAGFTHFSEDTIDPTTGLPFQTNTVIEYTYSRSDNKFVPMRTRWDKTANQNKHGNFSEVACNIFYNIVNPVEPELLFRFGVPEQDYYFERMRKFHNKIKEHLYLKYCKSTEMLLELCSGRGGDIHKWIYNKVQAVHGYDISEKNIAECKRRLENLEETRRVKYKFDFHRLDLNKPTASSEIRTRNPQGFDNVCCHFGIHYLDLVNAAEIISNNLKESGHFVMTYLDAERLDTLIGNNQIVYKKSEHSVVYFVKKSPGAIRIVLNGNNILGEGSDETIVDFQLLETLLKERGVYLVEKALFSEFAEFPSDFNEYERDICGLNAFAVFKKKENIVPRIMSSCTFKNYNLTYTQAIDLHKDDLSVIKVQTNHDVFDILNCIEFKYYKNEYEVTQVDSNFGSDLDIPVKYVPDVFNLIDYNVPVKTLFITQHTFTVTQKSDGPEEQTATHNNWYIVLHKSKLLFNIPTIDTPNEQESDTGTTDAISTPQGDTPNEQESDTRTTDAICTPQGDTPNEQESDTGTTDANSTPQVNTPNEQESDTDAISTPQGTTDANSNPELNASNEQSDTARGPSTAELYQFVENNPKKVTVKMLKDALSLLGIKTTGKKEDLVARFLQVKLT